MKTKQKASTKTRMHHVTLYIKTDRENYYQEFFYCTDVESDGPVLRFKDQEGNSYKTTVPWLVFKGPEKRTR